MIKRTLFKQVKATEDEEHEHKKEKEKQNKGYKRGKKDAKSATHSTTLFLRIIQFARPLLLLYYFRTFASTAPIHIYTITHNTYTCL
jgi:hypothetical protein